MAQDDSPETHSTPTQDELLWTRQIHGVIGLVLVAALAVVALIQAAEVTPSQIDLDGARAAISEARLHTEGSTTQPALLLSRGYEEVLWHAAGELRLSPPWERPNADVVALARDPLALPKSTDALSPTSPAITQGAWVARAYQGVTARRKTRPSSTRVALGERLRDALVEVRPKKGEPRKCDQYRFGRWFCGPQPWHFVGETEMNVVGAPARCVWMHPHDNAELRLTFPDVPRDRPLKGRITFSDEAAATPNGGAVTFKVEVNGDEVLKRVHPNRRGWSFFQVNLNNTARTKRPRDKTPPKDQPSGAPKDKTPKPDNPAADHVTTPAEVTFVVTARQTGRRHFCVIAEQEPPRRREAP